MGRFKEGATGDPINLQRRIAMQAERDVPPDESLYRDYRNNGGPMTIEATEIARAAIDSSGEPLEGLAGKRTMGGGPWDIGDADPSNIGLLASLLNVHQHYDYTDNTTWKRWVIHLGGADAAAAFLAHLEDDDIKPRVRAKNIQLGGYTLAAGPNANLRFTVPFVAGEYDFFGVPVQTAGGSAALAITSITRSGSVATVTTAAPHGLATNDVVAVSGATQTEYNVNAVITVLTATTFTYAVTGTPASPATGTPVYATTGLTITSITQSAGVATVTTPVAHGLATGDRVIVSGATQAGYNLTAAITVTGATTFTYLVASGTVSPATGTPIYARLNAALPVFARTYPEQMTAEDDDDVDLFVQLQSFDGVDTWTARAKKGAAASFSANYPVRVGLDSAGNAIMARVNDEDGAPLGGWADNVRMHLPADGDWRPGDTFQVPKRRASRWVQVLDPERPISSVALAAFLASAIGQPLEEIRYEGGVSIVTARQSVAALPDTPGRQGATPIRSGPLNTTATLTSQITDLRLQTALHEGTKFPSVFDAKSDVFIGVSGKPYRIAIVLPSAKAFGPMYAAGPGATNREQVVNLRAYRPAAPFVYDGVSCSSACTIIVDTDVDEADVFGA